MRVLPSCFVIGCLVFATTGDARAQSKKQGELPPVEAYAAGLNQIRMGDGVAPPEMYITPEETAPAPPEPSPTEPGPKNKVGSAAPQSTPPPYKKPRPPKAQSPRAVAATPGTPAPTQPSANLGEECSVQKPCKAPLVCTGTFQPTARNICTNP